MRTVKMKFVDGEKEVKAGDKIFTISYRSETGIEQEVLGIGRIFIKVGNPRRPDFYEIQTGRQKSEYTIKSIYSSQKAFEDFQKRKVANAKFAEIFRVYGYTDFTVEQIENAKKALGLS